MTIFAGAYAADPAQGALQMVMILPDRTLQETHPTDTKHGALTVLAQTGNRLTLQAMDGAVFYFDVPARRFVASLLDDLLPHLYAC